MTRIRAAFDRPLDASEFPRLRFSIEDAQCAANEWGLNCGPAAIAAVLGLTLEELRPHLFDFEQKRYTNPTLMWQILGGLGVWWRKSSVCLSLPCEEECLWPAYGLARVQWEGPWTDPGVPQRVRYRHTHWVASRSVPGLERQVFDINCMCVGGWIAVTEWSQDVVPWLLSQCEPKANGNWHLTHVVEVGYPSKRN